VPHQKNLSVIQGAIQIYKENYSDYVHYFREKFQSLGGWQIKNKNRVSNVGVIKYPIVVVV
jgi:hypothetical protein